MNAINLTIIDLVFVCYATPRYLVSRASNCQGFTYDRRKETYHYDLKKKFVLLLAFLIIVLPFVVIMYNCSQCYADNFAMLHKQFCTIDHNVMHLFLRSSPVT